MKTKTNDVTNPDVQSVPLIRCTVGRWFMDGNTKDRFAALGYGVEWPAGQVREITVDLFEACKSSGARLEIVAEA